MSSNVGLSTPRGSGTSGYVQRNLSAIKHRDRREPYPKDDQLKYRQRKPDQKILEHDRAREVEVKVFELRDKLEDDGVDEDEIEKQTDALRKKLNSDDAARGNPLKGLKSHQIHDMAVAKIQETERLRKALGISKDYEEGSHWKKQEEKRAAATEAPSKDEKTPAVSSKDPKPSHQRRRSSTSSSGSEGSSSRSDSRSRSRSP